MTRAFILLLGLCSLVTGDILEDVFWMASYASLKADEIAEDKGFVKNCAPQVASFSMDWYPKIMVKGETVTAEGNYTFPENFDDGEVEIEVKVGDFPVRKTFAFKCSMISTAPCLAGYTASGTRQMKVPREIPIPVDKFKVKARLINRDTGHEIGCAEADIELKDRDSEAIPFWFVISKESHLSGLGKNQVSELGVTVIAAPQAENFNEGEVEVEVKVGEFPVRKTFAVKCSMVSILPCLAGYSVSSFRVVKVPREVPIPVDKFKVTARLINRHTGHEIGCAEANIELKNRDSEAMPFWY